MTIYLSELNLDRENWLLFMTFVVFQNGLAMKDETVNRWNDLCF